MEKLIARLTEGVGEFGCEDLSRQIMQAGYYQRAAAVWTMDSPGSLELPAQEVVPQIQELVTALWTAGFRGIFLEWSLILIRSGKLLPANILPICMDQATKDLQWAASLVPVLGPLGQKFASLFNEWKILNLKAWNSPGQFLKKGQKEFAFTMLRNQDPEAAFRILKEEWPQLKEGQRLAYLAQMRKNLREEEWLELGSLPGLKNVSLQLEWLRLGLDLKAGYAEDQRARFISHTHAGTFEGFAFTSPLVKATSASPADTFRMLPPWFVKSGLDRSGFFEFVYQNELESAFLEALAYWPDTQLAAEYFSFVLAKGQLTERFPVEKLFVAMDHATFNSCCLKWLEIAGEHIDLEAFLHAVQLDKHFWNDTLCQGILDLRSQKLILQRYDLEVFWQLLPFKMNPASKLIPDVPETCRFFIDAQLHFDSILRFRKWMRR